MCVWGGSQDGQYVRRCTWPTTAADISAADTLGQVTKPGPFPEFSAGDHEVKVAVEYDGPSHFLSSGAPMGSTLIKRRHLQVGPQASSCFPCQVYQHNPYWHLSNFCTHITCFLPLQLLGYFVVPLPYFEWVVVRKLPPDERRNYLRQRLPVMKKAWGLKSVLKRIQDSPKLLQVTQVLPTHYYQLIILVE